ncbi:acetate--CoA ligase family protein [Chloroflexota bacterium]
MNVVEQIKRFIEPKSVAIFGVSRSAEVHSRSILQNLLDYGYQGRIYPVNPNATEILGVKAYPRVAEISDGIDVAVINLPRTVVPGVVKECIEHGVQSIVISTQGFSDAVDDEGKQLQREIDKLIKNNGVRILGPNSLGTANAFINFSSSFAKVNFTRQPIGVICQTGAFFFKQSGSAIMGKGLDLGNASDIDFTDGLEYYEQDDEIKVVALHIEGVRDGKGFVEAASRVARRKPVVALKTGRSAYAAGVIQSHTGSLAGKDEVWEAALKTSGVIRANDIDEFCDLAWAFSSLPLMKGKKIGILSISGGLGVASIDACHQYNLELAEFSPATMERIRAMSPSWLGVGNPMDLWPPFMVMKQPLNKLLTDALGTVFSDAGVDAVLLVWEVWIPQVEAQICQLLPKMAEAYPDKPLVCSLFGAYAEGAKRRLQQSGRVMITDSPEKAVRVLGRLAQYSAFRGDF